MAATKLGRRKMKPGDLIRPFDFDGDYVYEYRTTTFDGERDGKKYFRYLCLSPTGGAVSFPAEKQFWYFGHRDPTDLSILPKAKSIWESAHKKIFGPHPNPPERTHFYGDTVCRGCDMVSEQCICKEPEQVPSKYDASRAAGLSKPFVDREGDRKSNVAELLVAKYLGAEMVRKPLDEPDPGWDMNHRGWLVDVKWCESPKRLLLVKTWKPRLADMYVLVIDKEPVGWAWKDRLEVADTVDFGYKHGPDGTHKRYCDCGTCESDISFSLDKSKLRPMQDLLLITSKDVVG